MGVPRDVLNELFGCRTLVPSVDLPTKLLALARRFGDWLPCATLDKLLENGTLLPYHRPFLSAASEAKVRHTLLHGGGQGLKTMMGRVANRFGANPPLRTCPSCLTENWQSYGSTYWMRQHQLPGVNCCIIHGVRLQCISLQSRAHRQPLLLPAAGPGTGPAIRADGRQLRFAQISQELVDAALPPIDPLKRAATYLKSTLALGYRSRLDRADLGALASALCHRFDEFEGFEHQARLVAPPRHALGWLQPLFERPQQSLHPICHLLLIEFLFGSVAAFEAAYAACDPEPKARRAGVSSSAQSAKALRTYNTGETDNVGLSSTLAIDLEQALHNRTLSCRQIAATFGMSVSTVVTKRRYRSIPIRERRKSLHPAVIDRVLKAVDSLHSLPAVATQAGVSLSSVYRILSQFPTTQLSSQDKAEKEQRTLRRARWVAAIQACGANDVSKVTAARNIAGADYAWLYRHDRSWLAATAHMLKQSTQKCKSANTRVNWVRRDSELCRQLLQYLALWREKMPLWRLTKTRLIRPLGETMVRRNLYRLPRLAALLDSAVESALEFGMRRSNRAIALVVKEDAQAQQV